MAIDYQTPPVPASTNQKAKVPAYGYINLEILDGEGNMVKIPVTIKLYER